MTCAAWASANNKSKISNLKYQISNGKPVVGSSLPLTVLTVHFLVPIRARMLASPHSVRENGAPDATLSRFAEGAIEYLAFSSPSGEVR